MKVINTEKHWLLTLPHFPLLSSILSPAYPSPFYEQELNKAVDGAYPMLAKVCKEAAIDCHLADTRDIDPPLVRREGGMEGGREEGEGKGIGPQRRLDLIFNHSRTIYLNIYHTSTGRRQHAPHSRGVRNACPPNLGG